MRARDTSSSAMPLLAHARRAAPSCSRARARTRADQRGAAFGAGAYLLALLGLFCSQGCILGPVSPENALRAQKEYELSVGLLGEQNIPAAFEHLFKAKDLDPYNPEPHQLLGNLYLLRGDLKKSEEELRESMRLAKPNPSYGAPFVAEVENSLGVVLVHQKRYDDAIAILRESASDLLNRTPHLAWGNLGWAYYEKGQYTDAVAALNQSVRHQTRFCLGYYRLGLSYLALRDFEHAEEALTHCLEVTDEGCQNLQDAWHLRGQARARLGQREDAIGDFERCVELSASTATGRACQNYLEATH